MAIWSDALRPGNVHSADGWEDVLRPVLARYSSDTRPSITRRYFRGDAAFAIPTLFDLLEAEGWGYAIRIKGNSKLYERISWLLRRRPGRPSHTVIRTYTSFQYQAGSWVKPRRVVSKVEFHLPTVIDQNPCAHLRMPRDMIFHGWSMRLFQAWQHSATMSS